ncbi:MAG: hypothetical protein ACP5H8_01230 [Candidatus Micrarchaeia archaeon]
MPDIFKVFTRVIGKLVKRAERIRDKVSDIPSSFLVSVAKLKQDDEKMFKTYLDSMHLSDDDKDNATSSVSELQEYVGEIQRKGRNRASIKSTGAITRKATTQRKATIKR